MTSQPAERTETVIVFDWDDTILCSSFLATAGYGLDTDMGGHAIVDQLKELEACVIVVISAALALGEVHVVTNAETGWVQLSASKFLPGVVPYLSELQIVSARSTFESTYPENPWKWKFEAFHEKLSAKLADASTFKNIVSFGDSHVEREAVLAVTRGHPRTITKSVKFAERPSMEQLMRQMELVAHSLDSICSHAGDLDLCMSVTAATETADDSTPPPPSPPRASPPNVNPGECGSPPLLLPPSSTSMPQDQQPQQQHHQQQHQLAAHHHDHHHHHLQRTEVEQGEDADLSSSQSVGSETDRENDTDHEDENQHERESENEGDDKDENVNNESEQDSENDVDDDDDDDDDDTRMDHEAPAGDEPNTVIPTHTSLPLPPSSLPRPLTPPQIHAHAHAHAVSQLHRRGRGSPCQGQTFTHNHHAVPCTGG